ncbi:hypothetical protein RIF29_25037 [Crotalaria pallida]|uniref:RCHY1 zinc-ribbon domain-containing protein n=1 Tax=Crotalaria pallida TaxID=3830 RepID=A0AAN9EN22_CROPI
MLQIEAVPMPREYNFEVVTYPSDSRLADLLVSILCNDCNTNSTVSFHIVGHKCRQCNSYNTRRISTPEQQ